MTIKYLTWDDVYKTAIKFAKIALPDIPDCDIMRFHQWSADAPKPSKNKCYVVIAASPTGPSMNHKPQLDYSLTATANGKRIREIYHRMTATVIINLVGEKAFEYYDLLEPALYTDEVQAMLRQTGMSIYTAENGVKDLSVLKDTKWLPIISREYRCNWASKTNSSYSPVDSVGEFDTTSILEGNE